MSVCEDVWPRGPLESPYAAPVVFIYINVYGTRTCVWTRETGGRAGIRTMRVSRRQIPWQDRGRGIGADGRARKPWLMHSVVRSRPFHFIPLPLLNESIRNPPSTAALRWGVFLKTGSLFVADRKNTCINTHWPRNVRCELLFWANPPAAPAVHHRPEGLSGILYINTFL